MNSAIDLLQALRARGVCIQVEGENLRYRAPRGALTDALREDLVRQKPALLEFLTRRREASRLWEAALSAIADAWDRHAHGTRALGRQPAWIDDETLMADVRDALIAGDLARTLRAVAQWRAAWEEAFKG